MKPLLCIIAALSVALGGSLYALRSATLELGDTKARLQSLSVRAERAEALLAKSRVQSKAADERADMALGELRIALKNNRGWADEPVPADIAAGLCKYTRCIPGSAVPATTH